jgi:hypothetical protein
VCLFGNNLTNKNISGKQKNQIAEAVKKACPNGDGKIPRTAQQSIPFQQMFKDGICRVMDKLYTKTVQLLRKFCRRMI